jgi:dTDP-4-amino-4,6-dideoxygalactose transaminase
LQNRFAQRDLEALQDLQSSGQFIGGAPVALFEHDFGEYCGVDHVITTGNGLDALQIILMADVQLGHLPPDARILVPAHTYIATFLSIINAELTPVPVDVHHMHLTAVDVKEHMQDIDGVVAVDIYGKMVDEDVYAFAKANHLPIYTDTAQSHGATSKNGDKAGSRGRANAFSFYPTKNLGAMGDAGAIATNDKQLAKRCRRIANYGRSSRYVNTVIGMNSRMDTLQAAFLNNRLIFLDNDNLKRRKIASRYIEQLKNPAVLVPNPEFLEENAVHVFPIFCKHRDDLIKYLRDRGIETNCHYRIPPHQQEALSFLQHLSFPRTEELHATEISLPCHPLLEDHEVQEIIIALNEYQ